MKAPTLAAAALAAGIGGVPAMAHDDHGPVITGTRLDVTAQGEVTRVPDMAVVSAGVVNSAAVASAAMQENASRMARVIAALRKAGIAEKDVSTSSINLSPQYRYTPNETPVITGYQASNQLTVRFRNIEKAGAVLDALVREGANQISGPNMTIEKPQAALDEARAAAMKAAMARAQLYAAAAGLKVKRIVSISEGGGMQPVPMPVMARMAAADAAMEKTELMPGEQSLSITVSVVFELQ